MDPYGSQVLHFHSYAFQQYDLVEVISGFKKGSLKENIGLILYPPIHTKKDGYVYSLFGESTIKGDGGDCDVNEREIKFLSRDLVPRGKSTTAVIEIYEKC